MANDPKWIEHAHLNKGAFGAKAKAAGESTQAYAAKKADATGRLGRQARLAQTLGNMMHGGSQ